MITEVKIYDAVIKENGHVIINHISIPSQLQPFFTSNNFFARYESDISKVPLSILNIPAFSTIIHFAWATGYDVVVNELDETYFEGVEKSRKFLENHPGFTSLKLTSCIKTRPIRNNFGDKNKRGLLWSGGCDSTASWIAHQDENPRLIMIWGVDIPLASAWQDFWKRVVKQYDWMNLTTIISNTESIYTGERDQYFGTNAGIVEGYMPGYSFSVNRLGVCAPLTTTESIGELMISSTYPAREYGDPRFPWTKNRVNATINEYLSWADVWVHDVETEYSTTEKVRCFIKPYFDKHGSLTIRSCGHVPHLEKVKDKVFNCNICDKCQRVIGALIVNGIDPRYCGFNVNKEIYDKIIHDIENWVWNPLYLKYHWEEVQKLIPETIEDDFNGSRAFLEWLRKYEFDRNV